MKLKTRNPNVAAMLGLCAALLAPAVLADECKALGALVKFEWAADGRSAQAIVRNSRTGEETAVTIKDELTINRFRNKPLAAGSEIRAHFEKDGKNTCNLFEPATGGHDRGVGSEYFSAKAKN